MSGIRGADQSTYGGQRRETYDRCVEDTFVLAANDSVLEDVGSADAYTALNIVMYRKHQNKEGVGERMDIDADMARRGRTVMEQHSASNSNSYRNRQKQRNEMEDLKERTRRQRMNHKSRAVHEETQQPRVYSGIDGQLSSTPPWRSRHSCRKMAYHSSVEMRIRTRTAR